MDQQGLKIGRLGLIDIDTENCISLQSWCDKGGSL